MKKVFLLIGSLSVLMLIGCQKQKQQDEPVASLPTPNTAETTALSGDEKKTESSVPLPVEDAEPKGWTFIFPTWEPNAVVNANGTKFMWYHDYGPPDSPFGELRLLDKNQEIAVLGRTAEKATIGDMNYFWYRVTLPDFYPGWIYGAHVDILGGEESVDLPIAEESEYFKDGKGWEQ